MQACRETLGDRHPNTLTTIYNLADLLDNQGKITEAISLFTELLEARVSLLGMKHAKTRSLRNKVVSMLRSSGQNDEAKALATKHGV